VTQSPVTLLRRLPRTVRLLVAGTFINRLGSFVLPFLTLVLRREFHLTEGQTGLLLGAYDAGSLVSMLMGGFLTDRLGRRRTLLSSLIGSGTLAVAMAFAPSVGITGLVMHWAWFLLAVLLYTAGEILTVPQQSAFLADWAPPAQRGRYLGIARPREASAGRWRPWSSCPSTRGFRSPSSGPSSASSPRRPR